MTITANKRHYLEKVSHQGIISALAFDQRGALKQMMAAHQEGEATVTQIETLKVLVSEELTPYASSILLDPEYGLLATKVRANQTGLLLAYEKTGYDATTTSRLPDCLVEWSVKRLKAAGADAIKFCSIMMLMEMNKSIYKNKLILNALVQNVQLKTSLFS